MSNKGDKNKIGRFRSNSNLQLFSTITKETIEGSNRQSYSRLPYRDVGRSILNKD